MRMMFTLEQAKRHLRIYDDFQDQEILDKSVAATAIVLDYIDETLVDTTPWFDEFTGEPLAVPGHVSSAALLVLGNLWYNREGLQAEGEPLSHAVRMLLNRTRAPVVR